VNLVLAKLDAPDPVPNPGGGPNGGNIQYTISVTNTGTVAANNVTVVDILDNGTNFMCGSALLGPLAYVCNGGDPSVPTATNGVTFLSAAGDNGFVCVMTTDGNLQQIVTCTGGTLDGGTNDETSSPNTRQIVIEVFAPTEPGDYLNTAIVDPDDAIAENNELNNTDTTVLKVRMNGGGLFRDLTIDATRAATTRGSLMTPASGRRRFRATGR